MTLKTIRKEINDKLFKEYPNVDLADWHWKQVMVAEKIFKKLLNKKRKTTP